jgi:hypothetical protein
MAARPDPRPRSCDERPGRWRGRWRGPLRRWTAVVAPVALAGALGVVTAPAGTAAVVTTTTPSVVTVRQSAEQDVPALAGSEPDTLVEPDVAVSPQDERVAVAVAHNGRYPDGGAVGISYAWTDDGGRTWHAHPLPGVTSATGGEARWARASDPVAAFDAAGRVYVSTLLFNTGCDTAVAVSRSTDGGRTFGPPVLVHSSSTCAVSDDKNWLSVDTAPGSPHRGRLYQFWTPFLLDPFGNADGSPQAVAWSDDQGRTWSAPVSVSAPHANTQNSQPMLRRNGTVVDSYLDFGPQAAEEGPEAAQARHAERRVPPRSSEAAQPAFPALVTRISRDGGRTWTDGGVITRDLGDGPPGVRCCLPSATIDPVSGRMYAAWIGRDPRRLLLATSTDGTSWSAARRINRDSGDALGVNADVSAYNSVLAVSYGLTNPGTGGGRFARQFVTTSRDAGAHFSPPAVVGPRIDYAFAAQARGIFPGDYIGTAMKGNVLYAVWCVSTRPARAGATFHQVEYAATLDTRSGLRRRP